MNSPSLLLLICTSNPQGRTHIFENELYHTSDQIKSISSKVSQTRHSIRSLVSRENLRESHVLFTLVSGGVLLSTAKETSLGRKLTKSPEKLTGPVGLGHRLAASLHSIWHLKRQSVLVKTKDRKDNLCIGGRCLRWEGEGGSPKSRRQY